MKWSGWPLTATIAIISIVISYALFQLGIHLFFLPIIFFIPFAGFFRFLDHIHTDVQLVDLLHQEITVLDAAQDLLKLHI
jgi:hypothetical protein